MSGKKRKKTIPRDQRGKIWAVGEKEFAWVATKPTFERA